MPNTYKIAVVPGDGTGPEVVKQGLKVLDTVVHKCGFGLWLYSEEAEKMAANILRNDPWAIRSAKETILNVIGRPLDDQLTYEAFSGYTGAANPAVPGLLKAFRSKTDKGRVGKHETDL